MNLLLHMLLRWQVLAEDETKDQDYPPIERVLEFDISTDEAVVINIFDSHAFPFLRSCRQIIQAQKDNHLCIAESDPFAKLMIPEDKIPAKHKKHRDIAWEEIAPLLEHEDTEFLLYSYKRGPFVNAHSKSVVRLKRGKRTTLSITTINKRLRLWWQSGRKKNVFLPSFNKCGGAGKKRLADTTQIDEQHHKVGRRSALAVSSGRSDTGAGIRMTADIYRKFQRGLNKFYKSSDQRSLRQAYEQTIQQYFAVDYEIVNGKPVPVPPSEDARPTFNQFYYWYQHVRDDEKEKRAREGDIKFELTSRRMLGNPTKMGFAPGSLYQIDATIANLYLVSAFDRTRIIGRPVLYNCIDVFSAALTGFCVTLEGPSWLGGMLALDNVAMNKVAFCSEYGIKITEEEWPCMGLPAGLLADRGEFEGYNADALVNAFGIRVHNTGVRRADWKALVERQFGISDDRIVKFTPGYVPPRGHARGDPDYALRATLTLDEFRKLLICYALDYNINHYLKSYRKNEFMIADHVPRYPLEIWNWGIRCRGGLLFTPPQDIVRLNLLPRKQVSVTPRGIHLCSDLYYTCDLALQKKWFERARIRGDWKVEAAYDPRTTDYIYIILDGGMSLVKCHRTPASMNLPAHDWHEAMDYHALEQATHQASETRRLRSSAKLQSQKEEIVSEAVKRTQAAHVARGPMSKRSRRSKVRENRALEKQAERDRSTWHLGADNAAEAPGRAVLDRHSNATETEEYVPPASKIVRIGKLLEKDWAEDENS